MHVLLNMEKDKFFVMVSVITLVHVAGTDQMLSEFISRLPLHLLYHPQLPFSMAQNY